MKNSRKKIFLLVDTFHSINAGAERQIYELVKNLDHDRFQFFVGCLSEHNSGLKHLDQLGVQTYTFNVKRIYSYHGIRTGYRFKKLLSDNDIDCVMTFHFGSDIWGAIIGRLAGVKTILSNRRDMGFWARKYHRRMYRFVNRYVDRIVTNAEAIKGRILEQERVPPEMVEVIYNGVQLFEAPAESELQAYRQEFSLERDDLVLAHVANLRPVKGHAFLLEAMAKLVQDNPGLRLLIIGYDYLDGGLKEKVKELKLTDNVRFAGARDDVRKIIFLADVCLLPSLSEGMSNAILEYMVAGKPVVATDVGGTPELIRDGHNGLLVPPSNSEQIEDALGKLISNRELRRIMGRRGRELVVSEFAIPRMTDRYRCLFNELM